MIHSSLGQLTCYVTEHKAKDLYKIEKDAQACVEQALYMLQVSQLLTPIVQDSGPEEFKVRHHSLLLP